MEVEISSHSRDGSGHWPAAVVADDSHCRSPLALVARAPNTSRALIHITPYATGTPDQERGFTERSERVGYGAESGESLRNPNRFKLKGQSEGPFRMIAVINQSSCLAQTSPPSALVTNSPAEPFSEIPTLEPSKRHAACIANNLKAHSRLRSGSYLAMNRGEKC